MARPVLRISALATLLLAAGIAQAQHGSMDMGQGMGFDSGSMMSGTHWNHTFSTEGTFTFHCHPHPAMKGTVIVRRDAPAQNRTVNVTIRNFLFVPSTVVVPPNATVFWTNADNIMHTVTQDVPGASHHVAGPMAPWAFLSLAWALVRRRR